MEPLVFDARPYQHEGREPFAYIMKSLEGLRDGQLFTLINTFDPRPLESVMEARGFDFTVETKGPEHVVVTFAQTPEALRGQTPLVDRRGMPIENAVFQLAGVLRRLRIGETFNVWLNEEPSNRALNVLKTAGAVVVNDDHWTGEGYRLSIRRARPGATSPPDKPDGDGT